MTLKYWASIAVMILACAQPASAGQSVSTIAAAAAVYAQERATQLGHEGSPLMCGRWILGSTSRNAPRH